MVTFYEDRLVTITCKQSEQFLVAHCAIDSRIGDFVAIQVQNGQYRTGFRRIKKFVAMPGGRGRAGLRLTVTDDTGYDQIKVVHGSAKSGCQGITQLSAFVNSSRNTRIQVAGESAGPGKAPHKFFNSNPVKRQLWIVFMERAFQIEVGQVSGSPVPWSRDQEHIDVIAHYQVIEVSIDHVDTRVGTPVPQQTIFNIFRF